MAKKFLIILISLVALVIVGYFLTISVGKPIGTDLSVIGQGKPAIVLAYENHSPIGGEALNRLSWTPTISIRTAILDTHNFYLVSI